MSGININVCRSAQLTRKTLFEPLYRQTIRKCSNAGRLSSWSTCTRTSTRLFATQSNSSGKSKANGNETTGTGSSGRLSQSNMRQAESLLNTHMDKATANASRAGRPGSDGIFYMGIRPGDYEKPKNYKNWKELGTAGKVARTGARATSSLVILFGAGLTASLIYALATELGSRNSPTVLYADACEHIKASEDLKRVLPGNIKFHTAPPSIDRPRHRNRSVPSSVVIDKRGREHLYLNFWVEAQPAGDSFASSVSNWDIREWDWSLDNFRAWVSFEKQKLSVQTRRIFAVLTGEPLSKAETPIDTHSSVSPPAPSATSGSSSGESRSSTSRSVWSTFVGMFAAIRPGTSPQYAKADHLLYTSGEVHVDLVRNSQNNFEYRYILVDLPNSTRAASTRIFITRTAGVSEHESVMRFS